MDFNNFKKELFSKIKSETYDWIALFENNKILVENHLGPSDKLKNVHEFLTEFNWILITKTTKEKPY